MPRIYVLVLPSNISLSEFKDRLESIGARVLDDRDVPDGMIANFIFTAKPTPYIKRSGER